MVQGLGWGAKACEGSGDGVGVVAWVSTELDGDSSRVGSSFFGPGLALDRCVGVGVVFPWICFKAFCVRFFLLLSKSFAILAPSCLMFSLNASFCCAVVDAD